MVEMAMFNVQRAITPKVGKHELWFLCSARRLIMLYICVKFGENNSEVWWKYLWWYQSYGPDTNDVSAAGRTDIQNLRRYKIIPSPFFVVGHNEISNPNFQEDIFKCHLLTVQCSKVKVKFKPKQKHQIWTLILASLVVFTSGFLKRVCQKTTQFTFWYVGLRFQKDSKKKKKRILWHTSKLDFFFLFKSSFLQ